MGFSDALAEATPAPKPVPDRELIAQLEAKGYQVTIDSVTQRRLELSDQPAGKVRFGIVSDTHLGHKHQQLTYLQQFYEEARAWGCSFMLHGGDAVDGQNMHRDQQFELFRHGVDAQAKYAINNLPVLRSKRGKVLPTYMIGGNHDGSGWNDVGANVLGQVADNRDDITFLGAPTATFTHGPLKIGLMHPDGGPGYARSYKVQKVVEGLEADSKPHILLLGHWHVAAHVPGLRNVEAFAVPCFQSQTAYLKRKGLQPVIGGVLFEAEYDDRGLTNLTTKWVISKNPLVNDY